MTPPPVAGLLLAAGGGRRLGGRAKALLTYRGRTFVERAAEALLDAGCGPVHVVVGAAGQAVRARLADAYTVVANPEWETGMGSSLRAGLASLDGTGAAAALVALVDQPWVGAEAMARVRAAHRSPATLAQAVYGGERRGHPVLLGAAHFAGVARAARGDQGARAYLREHAGEITLVECGDVAAPDDIDEPGDLIDLPQ
ncbi:nucleotidyltransferase family protein [Streptomyces sp. URMC 129]|uniref:nucleotidyltransferase family protein n=1 Tax=Streptomyces sp. URMC 129 TaxID=3423407 RepID=UPI003F19BCD0